MDTGTFVALVAAVVGVAAAIFSAYLAIAPQALARREAGTDRFRRVRNHLVNRVPALLASAEAAQLRFRFDRELPLLTRPGWVSDRPLPLDAVALSLRGARPDESIEAARDKAQRYWPSRPGGRITSYSTAIQEFARPALWFNGLSYRLMEIHVLPTDPTPRLELQFSEACYFDGLDTSEPLAYETALRHMFGRHNPMNGPYRRWLADPFDLSRRCAIPGVNVLTLRFSRDTASFFLHIRDPTHVASMNTTHVIPAGEFQPHANVLTIVRKDLDLWRAIVREYAEEFLGVPDAAGGGGGIIDFDRDEPYVHLSQARRRGQVSVFFLGIGLDPLAWKPEICVACVWVAETFDRIFCSMISHNDEGELVVGQQNRGLEFTADNVLRYAAHPGTDPAAAACLRLAWRWRSELGLPMFRRRG
jgi:hypothetical protein